MKLVTWNVNSLGARMPRVLEFLEAERPDVALPAGDEDRRRTRSRCDELRDAGYEAVHHSGGRWAGVAILAREGLSLDDPSAGLPGELNADEARWIEATVGGLRVASVYVTNGRAVGTPTFDEKLAFLDAMAKRARRDRRRRRRRSSWPATSTSRPADVDVYDPAAFVGETHVTRRRALAPAGDPRGGRARGRLPRRCTAPTRSASRGGTTARATSTAAWACASTSSCSRGARAAADPLRHRARLPQGQEALRPRAARGRARGRLAGPLGGAPGRGRGRGADRVADRAAPVPFSTYACAPRASAGGRHLRRP